MRFLKKLTGWLLLLALLFAAVPLALAGTMRSNSLGQNLLLYSEQQNNSAVWVQDSGIAWSANSVQAPDGTKTADRMTWPSSTGNFAYNVQSISDNAAGAFTFSVWAKVPTGTKTLRLSISDLVATTKNSSAFTITTTWQRVSVTVGPGNLTNTGFVGVGFISLTAGDLIDFWGAQLVRGTKAAAYIQTAAAGKNTSFAPTGSTQSNQLGQNLIKYSERFENSAWVKNGSTVSANAAASPDGNMTADALVDDGLNGLTNVAQSATFVTGRRYTISAWVKAGNETWLAIGDGSGARAGWFNLSTGTLGTQSGVTGKITPASNGWYHISISFTAAANSLGVYLYGANGDGLVSTTSPNGTITTYLFGAQLNAGDKASAYNPTVASAISSAFIPAGSVKSSQLGQNLVIYSEQFDNAQWSVGGSSGDAVFTPNVVSAPDGTMTADKIDVGTGTYFYQSLAVPSIPAAPRSFTWSVWIYSPSKATIGMRMYNGPLTVIATRNITLTPGWQRASLTLSTDAATTAIIAGFDNRVAVGADGIAGTFYAWGGQLVVGSSPGTYNKTTASALNASYVP